MSEDERMALIRLAKEQEDFNLQEEEAIREQYLVDGYRQGIEEERERCLKAAGKLRNFMEGNPRESTDYRRGYFTALGELAAEISGEYQ